MKLTTALVLASLGLAGTACSETKPTDGTDPAGQAETVTVEDEYAGSLNLNIGGVSVDDEPASGVFNLDISNIDEDDGLIIGTDSYDGGSFEDAPALKIDLPGEDSTAVPVPEEDDIIRLDPN